MQVTEVFITSTVFLWFADFFGPYRQKIVMQEALSEILQMAQEAAQLEEDDQIDTIRRRYERIRLDSVSEYQLSTGRDQELIQVVNEESEEYEMSSSGSSSSEEPTTSHKQPANSMYTRGLKGRPSIMQSLIQREIQKDARHSMLLQKMTR